MPYHGEEKGSVGGVRGSVQQMLSRNLPLRKTNLVMPYHGEEKGSVGGVRGSVQQMFSRVLSL
jgi:hypothetical protein